MSTLQVHKFCRRVLHDPAFRVWVSSDAEAALLTMPLDEDERRALLAGDVAYLYKNGASAFLLLILSRFELFGLTLPVYNNRMRMLLPVGPDMRNRGDGA